MSENKNNVMMKFVYFVMIALCVLGLIGSFGWMCYIGANGGGQVDADGSAYVMAVGLIVTAFMVWPVIKELFRRMR